MKAVTSGAWKCLFFLSKKIFPKPLSDIKSSSGEPLHKVAEENGWHDEYNLIQILITEMLLGKDINVNLSIEKVIAEANKNVKNNFLIATDEVCGLHIPLPKDSSEKRFRQLLNQSENEERLKVIVGTPPCGVLMMDSYLETDLWLNNCQEAAIADILRVHEYSYVQNIMKICKEIENDKENESILMNYIRSNLKF